MSTTETVPARSAPSPSSSPGFSAAKVTVAFACTAPGPHEPLSASTPDGMSTASTGTAAGAMGAV